MPRSVPYTSTKGAILSFTLSVATELAPAGVTANVVRHEDAADVDDVADLAVQLLDDAGPRARHLDERLVRLHLRHRLVLLDLLAGLDAPLDELRLVHAFAEVGLDEVTLVRRLLGGHQ